MKEKGMDMLFKRFLKSQSGSFAVMGGVAAFLILIAVAVAVDTTRLVQASSKLKSLNDMAAIAATEGPNRTLEERKEIYKKVMQNGIASSDEIIGSGDDLEFDITFKDDGFTQVLSATSRTEAALFFPITRGEGKYVTALSEVTAGREFIEIALVLDISTSMEGPRIIEMQNAAKEFIEEMLTNAGIQGRVSISIVPFGGTVKLPAGMENLLIPPATTQHWLGGVWNGCLTLSPADYATGIHPQDKFEYMPDFDAFKNPWCPEAGNELTGLSNDMNALKDSIDDFSLSDGTATDIGVAWGLATLDPRWRRNIPGVDRSSPRDFNARTRKIMIVMADGGITAQRTPRNSELTGAPLYRTKNKTNTLPEARKGYQDVCDLTKTKNIDIYTVAFMINSQNRLNTLQSCGTSGSHNFEASAGQLGTAFENIAASISGLRLSQ